MFADLCRRLPSSPFQAAGTSCGRANIGRRPGFKNSN